MQLLLMLVGLGCGFLANAQTDSAPASEHNMQMDHMAGMKFDTTGLVMNANASELPINCDRISQEHSFTVHLGTEYADKFPGHVFGMSQNEYHVAPCSVVTITIVNEDQVRHQWMLHGLPRYLYPQGMFHLEAAGGETQTGSFIVPGDDQTYLVHCDMTQHMEKGMKAQLIVGNGSGDLWSIPGISRGFNLQEINNILGVLLVFSMGAMSYMTLLYLKK